MTVKNLDNDCLFCKIIKGEIPADIVYQDEYMMVFKDINPKAPIHLVAIPKEHHQNLSNFTHKNPEKASHYIKTITDVAEKNSKNNAYNIVFNTGSEAGQTIFHVHGHILIGGKFEF